jgi:hypothetical protein
MISRWLSQERLSVDGHGLDAVGVERHGDFPKHRRISANVVAWVKEEVMSWIHSKIGDIAV